MRAILGLAGLLVVLGVIVWIMGRTMGHTEQTLKESHTAAEQVSQMAGKDSQTGGRAFDSIDLDVMSSNRKPTSILVTKVVPDGAFERYFGLKRNDTITAIDIQGVRMTVRDMNDEEMAKAQVAEAYQRQGSLYVVRGGKEIKLPQDKSAAVVPTPTAPPVPSADATTPPPAAAPAPARGNPLQRQLDAITAPR